MQKQHVSYQAQPGTVKVQPGMTPALMQPRVAQPITMQPGQRPQMQRRRVKRRRKMQQQQQQVFYQAQPGAVMMQPDVAPAMMQPGVAQPVMMQPGQRPQMQWMAKPVIAGCPPGLEYLAQLDQLLVHQMIEIFEMMTGWETENRYRVFNAMGQQAYYAFEESDCCSRQCCGAARSFMMHIVDNMNQEVIRVQRPFKCTCGPCCGCCLDCQQEVTIEAPVGVPIGYAVQECFCLTPSFTIFNEARTPVFRIDGPCCTICPRCGDYNFNISSIRNGAKVGKITKQWSGFVQEAFTDADNFGVTFPANLNVRLKATLLGVLFLIDFMFFETNNQNSHFD